MRQLVAPLRSRLSIFLGARVRVFLPYAIFVVFAFVSLAILDNRLQTIKFVWHLVILLLLSLLYGVLNAWLLERKLFKDKSAIYKSLLTLLANFLGLLFFIRIAKSVGFWDISLMYQWVYLPALIMFSFPWLFYQSILAILRVPRLHYAPYTFESLKDVLAEYHFAELRDRGIRWVFEEDFDEVEPADNYRIRTHLPQEFKNIELGMLFKGVLSFHNHNLLPQRPIHFYADNEFYGWTFEHCPYWFLPNYRRAVDPLRSIKKCHLRFRRISEEERSKSTTKLTRKFRAATIYITRSK